MGGCGRTEADDKQYDYGDELDHERSSPNHPWNLQDIHDNARLLESTATLIMSQPAVTSTCAISRPASELRSEQSAGSALAAITAEVGMTTPSMTKGHNSQRIMLPWRKLQAEDPATLILKGILVDLVTLYKPHVCEPGERTALWSQIEIAFFLDIRTHKYNPVSYYHP